MRLLSTSKDEGRRCSMSSRILVTMSNFIILQSTLIEYNKSIEDEELQELSAIDLGDCKVLINVNAIMMVVENKGSTLITMTNLDRLVSNNSINEVIQKINASQVMASIQ